MIHAMLPSAARLLSCVVLTTAIAQGSAFAQATGAAASNTSSETGNQSLPEKMEQKLKDQGFTDVQVVPGSFLVSAKDNDGDPVTMIIGPHSMTVFTVNSSGDRSTTGSGKSDRK
jgi:hypothetical protein